MTAANVVVSTHAIRRYQERVRPAASWDVAERELMRLLALAAESQTPPVWCASGRQQAVDSYLHVGDIVFPVTCSNGRWVVVTCIAKGGISDLARSARNERRAANRTSRRSKRSGLGARAAQARTLDRAV